MKKKIKGQKRHTKQEPLHIYISYEDNYVSTIEDTYGHDGPYTGFRHEVYDFELKNAYKDKPPIDITPYWEQVKVIGATEVPSVVYVLYVKYSTGGTFSRQDGRGYIVNAYADSNEALKAQKLIMEDDMAERGYRYGDLDKKPKEKWEGYAPWKGYFERLESAQIEVMHVL